MLIIAECNYYDENDWNINFCNERGQLHRNDGPAVIYNDGHKSWYQNNKRHREDGPAIEYSYGTVRYFLNGELLTKEQFEDWRIMKNLQDAIKEELIK